MAFHHWQLFLKMGGYAVYVWPAYAAVLLTATTVSIICHVHLKRIKKKIKQRYA